jgi:hypothetical protein
VMGLGGLVIRWRAQEETLRAFGAAGQAEAVARCADELARAIEASDGELLTLTRASAVSGYSPDHLSRLIRQGRLANVGRPHAPRVRRGDLPRKAARLPASPAAPHLVGADPRQVVRAVVTSGKGASR